MSAAILVLGLAVLSQQEAKNYTIDVSQTTKEVKEGQDGYFHLQIVPTSGYKVSAEAPLKINLASAGVELHKKSLGHADAKDAKSTSPEFGVRFGAPKEGDKTIEVDATFFVCSDKICERKQEKMTVAVAVKR
jgi:hypothetical protein